MVNNQLARRHRGYVAGGAGALVTVQQVYSFLSERLSRLTPEQRRIIAEGAYEALRAGSSILNGITTAARDIGVPITQGMMRGLQNIAEQLEEFGEWSGFNDSVQDPEQGMPLLTNGDIGESLPDLSDLIPENTNNQASVGERRNREGERTQERTENMEIDQGEEPTTMVARSAAPGGGPSSVSKETPISAYPSLSYGLQETHTTVLPWTGYLTVAEVDKGTPAQLKIRMNSIWDMVDVTTGTAPADGAVFPSKGFYYKMLRNDGKASVIRYPESFADAAASANERPQWRNYFATLYEYYTVLGCEYKIILQNPIAANGTDVICAMQYDTYSDTEGTTGNIMPLTNLAEVKYFKNIKWYTVRPQNASEKNANMTIIEGRYKPGQAKRNITNDGDVKTWTKTDGSLPNLKELMTLNFWQEPLAYEELSGASHGVNMQIELKYIVQFKDLKQQARYPNTITTNQDIVQTLNEDPLAAGTAHHVRQY
jgi:hypothetical protein